jgi:hypothetical protein
MNHPASQPAAVLTASMARTRGSSACTAPA